MSLAPVPVALVPLLKTRPVHTVSFATEWNTSLNDVESAQEAFRADGRIHLEFLDLDPDETPGFDGSELLSVVRARGFMIRPWLSNELYACSFYDAYEIPSEESCDLFDQTYRRTRKQTGLSSKVAKIIGDDFGGNDNVPEQHLHIEQIMFAPGFRSREDLGVIIDALTDRFAGGGFCDRIVTMDETAIEGLDPEASAHHLIKLTDVMGELGFKRHSRVFVHRSMLAKPAEARKARWPLQTASNFVRTPL